MYRWNDLLLASCAAFCRHFGRSDLIQHPQVSFFLCCRCNSGCSSCARVPARVSFRRALLLLVGAPLQTLQTLRPGNPLQRSAERHGAPLQTLQTLQTPLLLDNKTRCGDTLLNYHLYNKMHI